MSAKSESRILTNRCTGAIHDRRHLCFSDRRLFRNRHRVRLRVREALIERPMENIENYLVGIVSVCLIVYLFWSLIRPENF